MMKAFNVTKKKEIGFVVMVIVIFGLISHIVDIGGQEDIVYSTYVAGVEDVEYSLKPNACSSDIYMLVLVGSHPGHSNIRNVIRETWGNPRIVGFNFKCLFLFGQPVDPDLRYLLEEESRQHNDILQGDFYDSYHNITTRDLMGLKWAWEQCKQAHFIMRADDDIALDVYYLIDVLEDRFTRSTEFVACFYITKNCTVQRVGRYALSVDEYPKEVYPDFCHGWMYMLTPSMANKLVEMSSQVKPFWINDVYITGTLVQELGMEVQDLQMNYTLDFTVTNRLLYSWLPLPYKVLPTKGKPRITKLLQRRYKEHALKMDLPIHKRPMHIQSPLQLSEKGNVIMASSGIHLP